MPRQLHFWIVLGGKNCRKGSTIRALTGAYSAKILDVMKLDGQQIPIWCKASSVNEAKPAPEPITWVQSLNEHDTDNFLVAFQLDRGIPEREASDYLAAISDSGAVIEQIVTLGETTRDWVNPYGRHRADIPNIDVPTNEIAHQVRRFWEWR